MQHHHPCGTAVIRRHAPVSPRWIVAGGLGLWCTCGGFVGCSQDRRVATGPVVVASIHPLAALAREICGSDAQVIELLPPGASPHSFEASPRVVAEGSRASLVVRVGLGLDDWVQPVTAEAVSHGAPELLASAFVDSLLPIEAHEELEEDAQVAPAEGPDKGATVGASHPDGAAAGHSHSEGTSDPHVWLDPLPMIPFCQSIAGAMGKIDPARAGAYQKRAAACTDSLRALDVQLRATFAPVRGVAFVATHNAWSYLCRRYGLRESEVLRTAATREPGPRRLVEIIRGAARSGARAVFTEVQVSSASANTLASELGIRTVMLDPQGTPDDPARNRYFDLLRFNARRIVAALTGTGAPDLESLPEADANKRGP